MDIDHDVVKAEGALVEEEKGSGVMKGICHSVSNLKNNKSQF